MAFEEICELPAYGMNDLLSAQQIEDVVAYLQTLKTPPQLSATVQRVSGPGSV